MCLLQLVTREFLSSLQRNHAIRDQIRAAPGKTLLYAGGFFKASWKEIADRKRTDPQLREKEILPEVLSRVKVPTTSFPNLLAYVEDLERKVPPKPDGFVIWRALSGIFAANAVGSVSFWVGKGVIAKDKVFAATEIYVLARNPNVDAVTKDALGYYLRCVKEKRVDMNFGFISA